MLAPQPPPSNCQLLSLPPPPPPPPPPRQPCSSSFQWLILSDLLWCLTYMSNKKKKKKEKPGDDIMRFIGQSTASFGTAACPLLNVAFWTARPLSLSSGADNVAAEWRRHFTFSQLGCGRGLTPAKVTSSLLHTTLLRDQLARYKKRERPCCHAKHCFTQSKDTPRIKQRVLPSGLREVRE